MALVVRRLAILAALLAGLAVAAPAQAASPGGWNRSEQRLVARAGLLPKLSGGRLGGERALTVAQLRGALGALAERHGQGRIAVTGRGRLSMQRFHRLLVHQLGLAGVARHVQAEARRAGLRPPARFGTEVVARFLGLRTNHRDERLERYPWQAVTRAEAAHSLAKVMRFDGWKLAHAREALGAFELPRVGGGRRAILRRAVARIGMPYVWGGETDRPSRRYGGQVKGGYDCSGLVWRVFKLPGGRAGRSIRGRTAAQQAGEIRRSARVRLAGVKPGDLLFFGPAGFGDRATERGITHEGIALSAEWMIHASGQGVYVSSLEERWRRDRFSWARRVL